MKAIDLFAGWGGFTLGAEQAGVDVVWAANHWPLAVQAHAPIDIRLDIAPETPFGPSIDWSAPGWRLVRHASDDVQERIAKGRRNHGRRFLTQHVTGHPGVGLDEPIRTITTKDQWALVDGDAYRPLTILENARAMGFPDGYRWPAGAKRRDTITGLGGAVCPPVARKLIAQVRAAA